MDEITPGGWGGVCDLDSCNGLDITKWIKAIVLLPLKNICIKRRIRCRSNYRAFLGSSKWKWKKYWI